MSELPETNVRSLIDRDVENFFDEGFAKLYHLDPKKFISDNEYKRFIKKAAKFTERWSKDYAQKMVDNAVASADGVYRRWVQRGHQDAISRIFVHEYLLSSKHNMEIFRRLYNYVQQEGRPTHPVAMLYEGQEYLVYGSYAKNDVVLATVDNTDTLKRYAEIDLAFKTPPPAHLSLEPYPEDGIRYRRIATEAANSKIASVLKESGSVILKKYLGFKRSILKNHFGEIIMREVSHGLDLYQAVKAANWSSVADEHGKVREFVKVNFLGTPLELLKNRDGKPVLSTEKFFTVEQVSQFEAELSGFEAGGAI